MFLALVRWCALVCRVVLCCVLLRGAAPFHAVLCCALLRYAVPWRVVWCCAFPCCCRLCFAMLRRAASCCAVQYCGGVWCAVLGCGVLFCFVSCCAVLCCAVLCGLSVVPLVPRGVVPSRVRLVAFLCGSRAQVMWPTGCWWAWFGVEWLAGSVLQGVWACRPVRWVRWVSVGLPSLCPLPSAAPCPQGCTGICVVG